MVTLKKDWDSHDGFSYSDSTVNVNPRFYASELIGVQRQWEELESRFQGDVNISPSYMPPLIVYTSHHRVIYRMITVVLA